MKNKLLYTALSIFFCLQETTHYISTSEFIEKFGQEGIDLLRKAEEDYTPSYSIKYFDDSLRIEGDITLEMYEEIKETLEIKTVNRFLISSPGGDIDASLKIGYLIYSKNIAVEIIDYCVSSCANYLFTAAKQKKIHDGAIVVWHGNSEQKDWREFDLCGRTVSSFDGMPMSEDEIKELSQLSEKKEWKKRRKKESDFYKTIKVNDYIARVGQEPIFLGNFTMSISDMSKFGLKNIYAPVDYASENYCKDARKSFPSLICMSVTEHHLNYEKSRKLYGESCSEDGRLFINSHK